MSNHFFLDDCNDDDVLSLSDSIVKVAKFREAIKEVFQSEIAKAIDNVLITKNITKNTSKNNTFKISNNLNFNIPQGLDIFQFLEPNDHNNSESLGQILLNQGIDCELLKTNKGWKKGKLRIKVTLEFIPEESQMNSPPEAKPPTQPKSPLDDIRKDLNLNEDVW